MRLTLPTLLLASTACFGGGQAGPDTTLAGDWFQCRQSDCTALDDDIGYRLLPDGTATLLSACTRDPRVAIIDAEVREEDTGFYKVDGDRLHLAFEQGGFGIRFEQEGDRITFFLEPDPEVEGDVGREIYLIRLATREVEECDEDPDVPPPTPVPQSPDLLEGLSMSGYAQDVEDITGERPTGSRHWQRVQDLCAGRLESLGFDVLRLGDAGQTHVLGMLKGTVAPEDAVLVGAHYDHIEACPGADDNATGVAGVLELARLAAGPTYDRTLVFACWDQGETAGLDFQARARLLADMGLYVVADYSFDMIGFASNEADSQALPPSFESLFPTQARRVEDNDARGDFIAIMGTWPSSPMMQKLWNAAETIGLPTLTLITEAEQASVVPELLGPEHASEWDVEHPAIVVTDTGGLRNPAYHCSNDLADSVDRLDVDFAARTVAATAASVLTLAYGDSAAPTGIPPDFRE